MRKFYDTESEKIISEDELRKEFESLQAEQPEEYDYTFAEHILNCTDDDGTLIQLSSYSNCDSLEKILRYEGMSGYAGWIIDKIEKIYGVSLED